MPVEVAAVQETTALGAAYLAGLGVGVWSDLAELATRWRRARRFEPRMSADQRDSLHHDVAARGRTRPGLVGPGRNVSYNGSKFRGGGLTMSNLLPAEAVMTENGFRLSAFEARFATRPTATLFAL